MGWRMNDTLGSAMTLRASAAFCAVLALWWDVQLGWARFSFSDAFSFLPYVFVIIHPKKVRVPAVGLSLGSGIAAALLADFGGGLARTREVHVVFASFAAANLLLAVLAIREAFASKQLNRARFWLLALAGFFYLWICALI
jgi:hypothetical protein